MMIANALGPVFLLIVIGAFLNRINLPGTDYWPGIERLTYYVLFPALLIHRLALAEFSLGSLGALSAVVMVSLLLVTGLMALLYRFLRFNGASMTSLYQGAIRFNTYIGLAVASALFGEAGVAQAALALGIMIPLVNVGCVLIFAWWVGEEGVNGRAVFIGLITNPLILACAIGLLLNATLIGLPGWSAPTLQLLGSAALPLGLLAVGSALNVKALGHDWGPVLMSSTLKFLVMPATLWAVAVMVGLSTLQQQILVLIGCLPTASSAYILARQLGGDASLMATLITAQTLLAFAVLPLWMMVVVGG
ncbi:AEC family transporter [Saccharospirillum salsuginis]|uniref:AEC family transporter n=1 Tax=Saccharospirillum salsuginis TaxID=418750 RepID=A0A918K0D2_9GAMM|nr:AEC family transporter [Saccharospirillum salsuginis]GGX38886.1 hypothetical protein GCM10007392_01420 [Saccharospirillum salsuginis]